MWICALALPIPADGHGAYGFFKKSRQKKHKLFLPPTEAEVLGHIWTLKSAI
jgi:hypothetical protein